jgi:hypothetical protein
MASWLPYISDFLSADPLRMVVLGALIGAILSMPITWFLTWWYYKRAVEELRESAEEMKREARQLRRSLHEVTPFEAKMRTLK